MNLKARSWTSERGAEVIEFAIVLPLLLLVIFGIVDFGFLFQRYVVLTNAAMEGARVASLPGYDGCRRQAAGDRVRRDGGIPKRQWPPAAAPYPCARTSRCRLPVDAW